MTACPENGMLCANKTGGDKKFINACFFLFLAIISASLGAQTNPYRNVDWATLPDGRTWGAVGYLDVAPDGEHIWAVVRCDATAVDAAGNMYGGEPVPRNLQKYVRVRP